MKRLIILVEVKTKNCPINVYIKYFHIILSSNVTLNRSIYIICWPYHKFGDVQGHSRLWMTLHTELSYMFNFHIDII